MLKEKIEKLFSEVDEQVIRSKDQLEEFRIKFLGKKGLMNDLFEEFKQVGNEQKKELGALLNRLKVKAQERFNLLKEGLEESSESKNETDFTLPGEPWPEGSRHPLSIVQNQIVDIFKRLGYNVSYGPEIEDDWHNFSALNFPENHPARDMQDTFFISEEPSIALRTHTSSVQVRVMENQKPPIRTISPGRVYRNEAISARANCFFHQVEGLYIDENVSFADLKQTLFYFVKEMFGENVGVRFRPSYFPFTEPSAEMDISCILCGGKGCNVCKYSGWVEILGCGMVDPSVLQNCGIDPEKYTGFAFGMGIERITMLKYDVNDLRIFFENDVRFLRQFHSQA
jgi:phenylalanyl-tRNA synthetase alpha chain